MAPLMRKDDVNEIWASGYYTPRLALETGIRYSTKSWTVFLGDEIAMIFGVSDCSHLGNIGVPWMLGTKLIEEFPITFVRHCKEYVSEMMEGHDLLVNYVDVRNKKSIRWLRWLGFDIKNPAPFGVLGLPFCKFEMRVH